MRRPAEFIAACSHNNNCNAFKVHCLVAINKLSTQELSSEALKVLLLDYTGLRLSGLHIYTGIIIAQHLCEDWPFCISSPCT